MPPTDALTFAGMQTELGELFVAYGGLRELARRGLRFRGSRKTRVFCLPTCRSDRPGREEHTVYFRSAAEAQGAGFRPCQLCRPA